MIRLGLSLVAIVGLLAQTFTRMNRDGAPEPTWCGRKCNCGQGQSAEIETKDGRRVVGWTPPGGSRCSCAEVYRCDPAKEGAPASALSCPAVNGWGLQMLPAAGVIGN